MKKIISIILSVWMLVGCFVSLIPSIGAHRETIKNGEIVPQVTKDELVYSENFEKSGLDSSVDAALLKELGWAGSLKTQKTNGIVNKHETYGYEYRDQISLVSSGDDHALEIKTYGSTYLDLTFVDDKKLAGGDYVVEYTYRLTDSVAQGATQDFGVKSGGDASQTDSKDTVVAALVQENGQTNMKAGFPGQKYTQMKSSKHPFEFYDFATTQVDYVSKDQTGGFYPEGKPVTRLEGTGSTYGQDIRFRFVVDNQFGISMWIVGENGNDTLIAYTNMAEFLGDSANWSAACKAIRSDLAFSCKASLTVEVDDIEVYTIKRDTPKEVGFDSLTPGLILSEFMVKASEGTEDVVVMNGGAPVLDANGNYKYGQDGSAEKYRHQWIEVYNAGDAPLNVYDYAIARECRVQVNNLYSGTVEAEEICYILPGKQTVTSAVGDVVRDYENPAYENGVLNPGEAAILFVPADWFNASEPTFGSVNTFKEIDLKGVYGMTDEEIEELKIFTICSEYNFYLNLSGNDLFALTPVEKVEGTETVQAKVLGHNIVDHDYIVSLSADFKDGKDIYTVFDGYGCIGYTPAQHESNEVMFLDAKNNVFVGHGVVGTSLSPDNKTEGELCTPGYIPNAHNRALHYVIFTGMILEADFVEQVYYGRETFPSVTPKDTLSQKFIGWEDEDGNFYKSLPAVLERGDNITLTAVYDSEIPTLVGYQRTDVEDGMYDIRIVAYVGRMDLSDDRDANDDLSSAAFGMQIGFRFVEDGETITGSKKYYCRYVYEEILEDYGSGTVSAESYESRYLVVFHVEGCDASKAVEFDVTTFAEFEDEYGARTTEWSEESMTFSIRF